MYFIIFVNWKFKSEKVCDRGLESGQDLEFEIL
jgi:hypothetical protein